MRRQISQAILAVAVLLVVGLGVPLAAVVQRFYEDRAVADLQRRAAETIAEISVPLVADRLAVVAGEPDSPGAFTVYDAAGERLVGPGPSRADSTARSALRGRSTSVRGDNELVLAAPITDRASETIVGAVRVTQPDRVVDDQVRRAWFAMAVAVVAALAGAAALAKVQARRLAAPVAQLARQAEGLGRGDFVSRPQPSGVSEVDTVADALSASAERVALLLARERSFSADVSHQIRTPLTGLRLRVERWREVDRPGDPEIDGALEEIARLEATVAHLLALSRDAQPIGAPLDVDGLLTAAQDRWGDRVAREGRALRIDREPHAGAARASSVSIGQVLDVLIDNSLDHGRGTIAVRSRHAAGGLVLEVSDEGAGISEERRTEIFDRGIGSGHGIGLAIARSITEAEGGRLLLATGQPPCFHIVLPTTGPSD